MNSVKYPSCENILQSFFFLTLLLPFFSSLLPPLHTHTHLRMHVCVRTHPFSALSPKIRHRTLESDKSGSVINLDIY